MQSFTHTRTGDLGFARKPLLLVWLAAENAKPALYRDVISRFESMPGVVCAFDPSIDARALIRSALTGMVDAICRDSARRLELPAPPPRVRTVADVSEAVISRLDGSAFDAPVRIAGEIATRVEQWARSVTGERERLVVRLDSPDAGDAWHLAVFASGPKGELAPIEHAIVNAGSARARQAVSRPAGKARTAGNNMNGARTA